MLEKWKVPKSQAKFVWYKINLESQKFNMDIYF